MRKYIYLALLLLTGTASTFAQTVSYTENTANTVFDNPTTFDSQTSYYRIPAITKDKDGNIIAITDVRIGNVYDVGGNGNTDATVVYNPISIVARKSTDYGATWGSQTEIIKSNSSSTGYDYAHGDAAVVTDRETGNMIMLTANGKTHYVNGGCLLGKYTSSDGTTWNGGEFTSTINTALTNAGLTVAKKFFTSGRIIQSSKVKVGSNYRIYSAMCTDIGSVVMYSDDFGGSWAVLGNKCAYSGGDETVLEELPNGDLLLSARLSSGRGFAVYNYSDLTTGTGHWNASTNTGLSDATNANGEMLLLSTSNSNYYVLLHSVSLKTSSTNRVNVTVYYKLINTASDDYKSPSFYTDWTSLHQMSTTTSCYSTMIPDNNGNVAYLFEENGTDGYDIQYRNFTVGTSGLPSSSDYAITYSTPVGGTVSAGTSAAASATVTLSNTPNSGYELDKYIVTDATGATVTVTDGTFTMPSSAVTVSATFKVSSSALTYIVNAKNGTFNSSTGYSNSWTSKSSDPTLTLTCVYPDGDSQGSTINNMQTVTGGETFVAYSANSNSSTYTAEYDLSVPEGYKIVSYSFDYVQASGTSLTVYDNDGNAYTSGNTVTVNAQTAKFSITGASSTINYETISNFIVLIAPVPQYTITCNSSTGGTVSATSPAYEGSTVTMTVTPDTGYELNALTVTDGSGNEVTVTDNTFTMPSSNVTVSATWKKNPIYTYTVSTSTGSLTGTSSTYYNTWTSTSSPTLTLKSYSDSECSTLVNNISSSLDLYVTAGTKSGRTTTKGYTYYQLSVPTGYEIESYSFDYSSVNNVSVSAEGSTYTSGNTVSPASGSQTSVITMSNSSTSLTSITPSNFTVKFKAVSYAITYDLNDGTNSVDNPSTYTIEDEVTLAAPTKTGYTFTGWTDSEGNAVTSIAEGSTGAITLTANWEIEEYTISYNLDDGTNADTNPATYTVETDDITLAEPTKQGYIFQGWTYGSQLTPTKTVTIAKGTTGDLTYTANWESKYTPDPDNHNVTIKAIVTNVTETEISEALQALGTSATDNTIIYDETGSYNGSTKNVVVKNGDTYTCASLVLTDKVDVSIPTAFTATSATYSRDMGTSNWGTICLPFAPKASGVTFYTLKKESDKTDGTGILAFTAVESPKANVPYVFRTDLTESTISNTNCSVAATVGVDLSNASAGWRLKGLYVRTTVGESESVTMPSTASDTKVYDANSFYIKNNKFYKINNTFTTSAFRAYFSAPTSVAAKASVFSLEEYYETDAINTLLNPEEEVVGYFNADGMKMNNIQKGLNIVKYKSGKIVKIMIK